MICPKCGAAIDIREGDPYSACSSCGYLKVHAYPFPRPAKIQDKSTPGELKLLIDTRSPVIGGLLLFVLIFSAVTFIYFFSHDPETKKMGSQFGEFMREESPLFVLFMLPSLVMPFAVLYFTLTLILNRKILTVDRNFITRSTIPLPGLGGFLRLAIGDVRSLELENRKNYGYRVFAITEKGRPVDIWPADTNPHMALYIKERVKEYLETLAESGGDSLRNDFSKALDGENRDLIITMLDGHPELADLRSAGGRTGLTVAASQGDKSLAKILLDLGADVNLRDRKEQRTALHYVSLYGHRDILELLIDHKADINVTDREGNTPLHFAIAENHREIAEKLTALGARETIAYNVKEPGFPWQMLAPLILFPLFILLAMGLSSNNIHMAAGAGDLGKVKRYIEANPGLLNEPSAKFHETPLQEAASSGRLEVVKYLVEKGADCSIRDGSGHTALEKALARGHNDVAQYLLAHTAKGGGASTPLHAAADSGNIEGVKLLMDNGCDVNERDSLGKTALHYAVACDSTDVVKLLIEKGGDVNAAGSDGMVPLHNVRSDRMVRILVRKGADVKALDEKGRTPLHYAARGFGSAVEELIACGADVNARDREGKTPLFYARGYRYSKKVILEHGGKE